MDGAQAAILANCAYLLNNLGWLGLVSDRARRWLGQETGHSPEILRSYNRATKNANGYGLRESPRGDAGRMLAHHQSAIRNPQSAIFTGAIDDNGETQGYSH
jgi:hypothetical protein